MIRQESNDRALAGVSALIVFIALVLVAAIAAAVILDTGGFLQQQAQQTGEESSDQLSSTLNVVHTVGDVTQASEDFNDDTTETEESVVNEVRMTVAMAPGAENLDLSSSTIEIVTENGASTLTYEADDANQGDEAEPSVVDEEFGILQVEADATYPLVTQPEDRYQLVIPFDGVNEGALDLLQEGDSVETQIVTGPGGQTYESFRVPTALPDEETSITL